MLTMTRAVLAAALAGLALPCAGNDALRERLLREGPQGWKELQAGEQQFVGSARYEQIDRREGNVVQHVVSDWKIKRNGDWILFEWPFDDGLKKRERRHSAWGRNSTYGFTASRGSGGQWMLADEVYQDQRIETAYTMASRVGFLRCLRYSWAIVGTFPLEQVVADPSFKIESLGEEGQLVRLVFKASIKPTDANVPGELRGGKLLLDPSLSWAIRECEVIDLDPAYGRSVTYTVDYRVVDSMPWPAKIVETMKIAKSQVVTNTTVAFDAPQFVELPESDFQLTALGLPEPVQPKKSTRWWLWMTIAGGVLLILGIGFLRLRKSR